MTVTVTSEPRIPMAFVGTGAIARDRHVPTAVLDGRLWPTACVDIRPERAQALADRYAGRFQTVAISFEEVLARPDIRAVAICTHPNTHADLTIRALKAGKHVLCEKPPATSPEEVRNMVAAASGRTDGLGRPLTLLFGTIYRHMVRDDVIRKVRAESGPVYYALAQWVRRHGLPAWVVSEGNGPFADLGVHILDLLLWLVGYPAPKAIWGHTSREFTREMPNADQIKAEDTAIAWLLLEGLCATVHTAFVGNTARLESVRIEEYGPRAGLQLPLVAGEEDPELSRPSLHAEEGGGFQDTVFWPVPTFNDGWLAQYAHFYECIVGRAVPTTKPREMVILQGLVNDFYKSAEAGQPIFYTQGLTGIYKPPPML